MANPGPSSSTVANAQPVNTQQAVVLLASALGVNANMTGDAAILAILPSANRYSVDRIVITNGSISLTNAAAGVFTAPAAGGTAIKANAALSGITGPTVVLQATVASTAALSQVPNLYFNFGTAQGAAATVDIYIYGYVFS